MNLLFAEWRDELASLAYPFADPSLPLADNEKFLPPGVVIDALIHPPGAVGGYYLRQIVIGVRGIELTIYDADEQPCVVGEWSRSLPDPTTIPLTSPDGSSSGVLITHPLNMMSFSKEWGLGEYTFERETSLFVPSTWEFVFSNTAAGEQQGVPIDSQGDIYLVAEDGMRFECQSGGFQNVIAIHAVGDPLVNRGQCEPEFDTPRYIKSLVFQHGEQTVTCPAGDLQQAKVVVVGKDGQKSALRINSSPGEVQLGFFARST